MSLTLSRLRRYCPGISHPLRLLNDTPLTQHRNSKHTPASFSNMGCIDRLLGHNSLGNCGVVYCNVILYLIFWVFHELNWRDVATEGFQHRCIYTFFDCTLMPSLNLHTSSYFSRNLRPGKFDFSHHALQPEFSHTLDPSQIFSYRKKMLKSSLILPKQGSRLM